MGGGGDESPLIPGLLNDGDGQSRTLHRVCAGAQLVKQQQTVVIHLLQDPDDVGHMGREGRQALLDALLISYVRQHPAEHPHGAAAVGGDVQAALGHQAQQANGFQGHGFAAGVGAGDDQGVELLTQLHGDRHRLGLIQQRMPGPAQGDAAPAAHLRAAGVELIAQLRPCKDHIQLHQNVVVPEDVLHLAGTLSRELAQDTVDLLLLTGLQFLELVVGLHHAHRLHEQRGTGGGNVVDQTRQTALALGLHRHHEAAVPLGDEGLLQDLGIGGGGDDALQDLPALGGRQPHFPADIRQLAAGGVGNGLLVQNGGAYLILQIAVGVQRGEQPVQHRGLPLPLGVVFADPAAGGQHACHIQQFTGVQHTAVVGTGQGGGYILDPGEGGAAVETQPLLGGVGLIQQMQHLLRVRGGSQAQAPLLGGVADRLGRQLFQHRRKLQRADGFFKQISHM